MPSVPRFLCLFAATLLAAILFGCSLVPQIAAVQARAQQPAPAVSEATPIEAVEGAVRSRATFPARNGITLVAALMRTRDDDTPRPALV